MVVTNEYTARQLDEMRGQPAELSRWAYQWRADRSRQEKPEAYFIPRRLERIDKVYRTALPELGDNVRSIFYQNQLDMALPLPPPPSGSLLAGLLWVGGISKYRVELVWPEDAGAIPSPGDIEVRTYPTAWGWFGWTVDSILSPAQISDDKRVWTFLPEPGRQMDFAYNLRVDAATEMIAVFGGVDSPIPEIHVSGESLGEWARMDVVIEWGFDNRPAGDFITNIETHMAHAGQADMGNGSLVLPVVYSPVSKYGLDSRLTVHTAQFGATVLIRELEHGPVYVPEQGLYIRKSDYTLNAAQYMETLRTGGEKNIRQKTREHAEATSWDEIFRNVRLRRCSADTSVPPFPESPRPEVEISLSDSRWSDMYRAAIQQLKGQHMWGNLATEIGRVTYGMELLGLHSYADKVYDYFLASPGVKSEGDFSDPKGSLEWAKDMRHDIGYAHEGTHCSTGRLLFSMAQRYFLTCDREWFEKRKGRLKQAADWIINEITSYMAHIPNRDELLVAGLMPPSMLGDYALPACDWRWYYVDNALALQGLQRFADVLADLQDSNADYYTTQAGIFRANLLKAARRDALYAPVRKGRDGVSRSFIPRMAYSGGLLHYREETNIPNYGMGIFDLFVGALPLAEPFAALDPADSLMEGTIDALEEAGTYKPAVDKWAQELKQKNMSSDDAWFWFSFVDLPKCSHNANIYLMQDDIPNFLRYFLNTSITMVGADGKLWEHAHPDSFDPCAAPDNGTAGWFVEILRHMLVTEQNGVLWLAKGTPRYWLGPGKSIKLKNAPTLFGTVGYEIVSGADGVITAHITLPDALPAESVVLRLRHPQSLPLKKVEVNGKLWPDFDAEKEMIRLDSLTGSVVVKAEFYPHRT